MFESIDYLNNSLGIQGKVHLSFRWYIALYAYNFSRLLIYKFTPISTVVGNCMRVVSHHLSRSSSNYLMQKLKFKTLMQSYRPLSTFESTDSMHCLYKDLDAKKTSHF